MKLVQMENGDVVALMDFPRADMTRFRFVTKDNKPLNETERSVLESHHELFYTFHNHRQVVDQ